VAKPHLDRERIARCLQVIAEDAVEHGEQHLALGTRRALAEQRGEPRESDVDARAHETGDCSNAAIGNCTDGANRNLERSSEDYGAASDLTMRRFN